MVRTITITPAAVAAVEASGRASFAGRPITEGPAYGALHALGHRLPYGPKRAAWFSALYRAWNRAAGGADNVPT